MIKQDEKLLYAELRKRFPSGPFQRMPLLLKELGIPWKRGHYILEKWDRKRFIDSGVSVRCGWWRKDAPEELS